MRRIAIIGAGQAGLVLAIGLRRNGYDVTVVAERTAGEVRSGRLISNQCVFHPALARERELGINFWDADVVPVGESSSTRRTRRAAAPRRSRGGPGSTARRSPWTNG
ncbi:FAD-dependent oxidoreductase [Kibdelosporangium phytohabitans]|uniref:FAD-dependent oxidoreductase n=1 Tax=Kibdelosporangium phytohabitans TaxID=860235 RepID=UPI0019FE5DA3|nr:FAD-dependent oxidoreductase [Kibdelosporangium phytohabitans]MBE1470064.1 2-polyprenyl-6-methoxyphenol hydroxylase-like FAD-dependent oxidoreductase [Kibdelosporangium phytohabitans]